LCKEIADSNCVGKENLLLVFAVGDADAIGNLGIRKFGECEEKIEIWLVGIVCLSGRVAVWN
jgi:hypothetical protein